MKKTYATPDIHCHSCAGLIGDTLGEVSGVSSVSVDVKAKTVTVDYAEPSAEETVLQRLSEEGYPSTAV